MYSEYIDNSLSFLENQFYSYFNLKEEVQFEFLDELFTKKFSFLLITCKDENLEEIRNKILTMCYLNRENIGLGKDKISKDLVSFFTAKEGYNLVSNEIRKLEKGIFSYSKIFTGFSLN